MSGAATGVDFVVVGAGIFGCYAALFLQRQGFKVLLVEREARPWQKASAVNQARLHGGYHYPRSIATARLANGHRARFLKEHRDHVNHRFTQYYGIDRHASLTDAEQFQRFCRRVGIPARPCVRDDLFLPDRLEALFETTEFSFDPYRLRHHYERLLQAESVPLRLSTTLEEAEAGDGVWRLRLRGPEGVEAVAARGVVNAAYANLNAVNRLFGVPEAEVVHELSELVLFSSPALEAVGLSVMDGPYLSLMPYGLTGLHSLSSVPYTHHSLSSGPDPRFACQDRRPDCAPGAVRACTTCPARPASNARKMRRQLALYLRPGLDLFEYGSLYTVKTKLKSSFVDDARPTQVGLQRREPLFFTVFSGKINSIYEVETLLNHV